MPRPSPVLKVIDNTFDDATEGAETARSVASQASKLSKTRKITHERNQHAPNFVAISIRSGTSEVDI